EQGSWGAGYGLIAPYWDDLRLDSGNFGGIFTAYDDLNKAFIIEWYNAQYDYDFVQPRLFFQILLYETDVIPTPTGDGLIKFQYRQIPPGAAQDIRQTPFHTVGLASPDGTTGLTYVMANNYPATSAPIINRRAVTFTTASRRTVGTLTGVVRDAATGRLLEGALVQPSLTAPILTDNLGRWQTTVYAGVPFTVTVRNAGFNDSSRTVSGIEEGGRVELPIGLRKPVLSVTRPRVDILMETNDLQTRRLAVRNRGNGVLNWSAALTRVGEDPQNQWSLLSESTIPGLEAPLFVENHYVVATRDIEGVNRIIILDPNFNIEAQYQVGLNMRTITDLAWEEARSVIWFAQGNRLTGLNWNGETVETYDAPNGNIQGVACESDANGWLWYAAGNRLCGLNQNREIVHEINLPRPTVRGLAWRDGDPLGHPLHVMIDEGERHYIVLRINPEDESVLPDLILPISDGSFPRGVSISEDFRDDETVLLVASNFANSIRNKIRVFQLSGRLGWVSLDPSCGQVEPRSERAVALTFNSAGLPQQLKEAELHLFHNGLGGHVEMEVTMEVVGEHPPASFALSKPGNRAARDTSLVTFTWEPSYDPNPHQWIGYHIWLQMRQDSLRFQPADTFLTVRLDTLFRNIMLEDSIRWWVKAFGGRDSTECEERFSFRINPAETSGSNPAIPVRFGLENIYPNPFNSAARIQFGMAKAGLVRMDIYDLTGRLAARILERTLEAGRHTVSWNAGGVPTGIYFARLNAGNRISTQKIAIVR
ncbi:MAG: T9SS type A sorting domain-containing protein, partial [Calditrichota bacterium]